MKSFGGLGTLSSTFNGLFFMGLWLPLFWIFSKIFFSFIKSLFSFLRVCLGFLEKSFYQKK